MKKRILSILLVVCMVVGLLPFFAITAMAAGEVTLLVNTSAADDSATRGTGAKYKTLAGAVAKAVSGDTIKLETDCVVSATIGIEGVTLVLDLNDKSITCDVDNSYYTNYIFNVGNGGTLTVTDTANGLGKIQYPSPIAVTSNGTVTVAGGTIKAISGGYGPVIHCNNSAGTVNVTGGTVIADNGGSEGYGAINGGGTVNISGGTVVGTGDTPAIKTVGTVNVSGGSINSLSSLSGSTINVTGGNIGLFRIFTGGTAYVTGGTINRINHDGTLQNRNSQSLRLYVLTGGDPNTAVSSFSVTPALGYTYGINDVKTDGEGKIYVWMPEGITNVSVTAGGKTMTIDLRIRGEEITNCSPRLTLPSPGAYGQMFDFYGTGYSGRVTWSPSATPFLPGKVYTGTFILTAVESYTFTGMTGAFTVSGATSVTASDNTGTTLKLTAVFPETPSPQNVTVAVKKDGAAWTGHGKSFALYQDGSSIYSLNSSGSNASVYPGTYDIYEGTTDTGVDITVSKGGANSATVNYYTVTFKSQDGNTPLNTQTVLAGQDAVYGGTAPNKTADAQYTYTFSKWVTTINGSDEAVFNNITSTNTVFACFVPTLRSYNITWKKDSSTTIDTTTVDYGLIPSHVAPTKTGCSFAGWEPAIGSVTGDAIYTAAWEVDPYSISYVLNGGTVSSATNPDHYTIESTEITLNNPTRSGYTFVGWSGTDLTGIANQTVTIPAGSTGAKSYSANWKADAPPAPQASIVTERTDKRITIAVENDYEYSLDGTNWHTGTGSYTFIGLTAAQPYNLVCRKVEVTTPGSASAASDASAALVVSTKNAAPAAPPFTFDSITANSVTISEVTGGEYSKDGGLTWQDSNTFIDLSAATKYHFAVRIKETDTTVASPASAIAEQYTAAATPSAGEGYTIHYSDGTIGITSGYEVSTSIDFSTSFADGDSFTPGTTYYVRKAKDTETTPDTPASEAVSFTVSARPEPPSADAYSYDYEEEQIIFDDDYEVYTATSGGSAIASDATLVTPGSTIYIRVKSTDSAPASDWTMITVPARPGTAGLSISTSRTDTTITVTKITGAEYSKDGGNTWQSSNELIGLDADTDYDITIRYAADSAFASDALPNVTVRTKTSAGDAPSVPTVITQTDHTITIDAIAGCQYTITTSNIEPTIWGAVETTTGTKTFSSLSAATRYYIWVRVAETDTATPSGSSRISVYTAATVPSEGEGYTIDYSDETIHYDDSIYEITADTVAFPLNIIESGDSITSNISDYNTAAQKIYIRIKEVADGAPAGAWMEATLPARPETPSSSASDETVDNKNDGWISGVTTAMEWKAAGGAYAAVTDDQESNGISGLPDGTYYVRYMAVRGTGFKSNEQEITIAEGHTITVTFNSQNGSDVDAIIGKAYGDSVTAPADPVRSGFYFAGWYKDAACTNPWTFTLDALTDHMTLFAKWSAIPAYTVTGRIVDDTSLAVVGATVRMVQGAIQFGTTGITDTHGDFTIEKVPPGIYNLVITKGAKTAIIKVEVSSGNVAIGNATLPSGNANSILVVTGSETPNVVVGGLDSEAGAQLSNSDDPLSDHVEITLTVAEKNAATAANGIEVTSTAAAAGKQVGIILSIDVRKTVNGSEDTSYNQTNGLIEINIPLPIELQGKSTYAIYRYHGSSVDTITEMPNDDAVERIAIDRSNWIITLYANKFSTYAIGYTNPSSGRGGGTVPKGTTAAAIESQETAALPYYVENGKEVFIGFTTDASGRMKYIAPKGVTVLFRKNPKNFNDLAGHWAKKNIDFVTERELFLGTGDGEFSPQSGMTRAMFSTVIGRLYERSYGELLQKDNNNFTDIDNDSYYAAYVSWASENNIITGVGGGLFKPDQEITRQEMAAILYRFAEFLSVLPSGLEKTQLNYPDASEIASWAAEAAGYCQQTGIITGRSGGNFVPTGTATRAEVAAILQRFIESSVK